MFFLLETLKVYIVFDSKTLLMHFTFKISTSYSKVDPTFKTSCVRFRSNWLVLTIGILGANTIHLHPKLHVGGFENRGQFYIGAPM